MESLNAFRRFFSMRDQYSIFTEFFNAFSCFSRCRMHFNENDLERISRGVEEDFQAFRFLSGLLACCSFFPFIKNKNRKRIEKGAWDKAPPGHLAGRSDLCGDRFEKKGKDKSYWSYFLWRKVRRGKIRYNVDAVDWIGADVFGR